jgi:ketosteroid isomerase-like protein
MKKLSALCALLTLLLAAAFGLAAQNDANRKDEEGRLIGLEQAWNHAEQEKNVKALSQLLDSSLVYIDYDGSLMNKAEFLSSVNAQPLHVDQLTNESMAAHVYGDAAVVTGIYREKGTNKGKPFSRRGRFTDTWIKQGGDWLCVASQSTLFSKP